MRRFKHLAIAILLFALAFAVAPAPGHAADFFDKPDKVMRFIDSSLLEGMISGPNGVTIKAAMFMDQGATDKDPENRALMNKLAWYNVVNAHRMLDGLFPKIQNPAMKAEMKKSLQFLDSGISLIGKRFGWNDATIKAMYAKTRSVIEGRIDDLRKTAFTS